MPGSPLRCRSAPSRCTASPSRAWPRTGDIRTAPGFPSEDDQRIIWMRQLIEWAREMREPSEFLSTLKVDLYPEEVYIFTPKGKVVALPRGATPVDFAYAIHTEVGHQCVGAKVNGQMVPLRHPLWPMATSSRFSRRTGHGPSRDWLSFVRTSHARSKIRQWINLHERQQATDVGRRLVEREARQSGVSLKKISDEDLLRVASEYGRAKDRRSVRRSGLRKIFRAAGRRQADRARTAEEQPKGPQEKPPPLVSTVKRMLGIRDPAILVLGQDNLMVYRAKCCNSDSGRSDRRLRDARPRRGRSQHRLPQRAEICSINPNAASPCSGANPRTRIYPVTLVIHAKDRPGLLASITSVISAVGANIQSLDSRPDNLHARIEATLEITDRDQLERILKNIKRISGVSDVERLYPSSSQTETPAPSA